MTNWTINYIQLLKNLILSANSSSFDKAKRDFSDFLSPKSCNDLVRLQELVWGVLYELLSSDTAVAGACSDEMKKESNYQLNEK